MFRNDGALDYLSRCSHTWGEAGDPFKTYPRADQGPDNPLRQAYKCRWCGEVWVKVISTAREQS